MYDVMTQLRVLDPSQKTFGGSVVFFLDTFPFLNRNTQGHIENIFMWMNNF